MPELPEVETVARGLSPRVTGDLIESVWLGSKLEPLKSPAAEIAATLEGKKIAGVRRVGKHVVFDLEPGDAKSTEIQGRIRPMDCSSGNDRAFAGLSAGDGESQTHPRDSQSGFGKGNSLCRSAEIRAAQRGSWF